MADPMSNYMGGPRHAPVANVADPDLAPRKPVGTISRPAMDSDVQGTSDLLSGPKRNRPGAGSGSLGGLPEVTGPIDTGASQAIVDDFQARLGKAGQAAEKRPESTGDMTSPDHPMMGGLRRGRPSALSAYGQDFQAKIFSKSPAEQQMADGFDTSQPASKPRYRGQVDDTGTMSFSQIASDLGEPE